MFPINWLYFSALGFLEQGCAKVSTVSSAPVIELDSGRVDGDTAVGEIVPKAVGDSLAFQIFDEDEINEDLGYDLTATTSHLPDLEVPAVSHATEGLDKEASIQQINLDVNSYSTPIAKRPLQWSPSHSQSKLQKIEGA